MSIDLAGSRHVLPRGRAVASLALVLLLTAVGARTPAWARGPVILRGHTGPVTALAYSPDGKTLATGSEDKTIRLWDPTTGEQVGVLEGHTGRIIYLAYTSRGKDFVSAGDGQKAPFGFDADVISWDARTLRQNGSLTLHHSRAVTAVALRPDGKVLASLGLEDPPRGILGSSGAVRLWDTSTGKERALLTGRGAMFAIAFSPDSKLLASGSGGTVALLWDAATGRPLVTLRRHPGWVVRVAFSPDSNTLATACLGEFNLRQGQQLPAEVKLWDRATWRVKATLKGFEQRVTSLAFSPDRKRLATATGNTSPNAPPTFQGKAKQKQPDVVQLWDVVTQRELARLEGSGPVAFAPDGKTLAVADGEVVKFWDVAALLKAQGVR